MSDFQATFELSSQEPIEAQFDMGSLSRMDAVFEMKVDFTVSIGETETLPAGSSAYVDNVGTPTNIVLNFGIPRGIQGERGETGPEGPAGEDASIIIRRL